MIPSTPVLRKLCAVAPLVAVLMAGADAHSAETDAGTWCRFVPERSDDFAWENDQVAFRTYGPALRSGKEDSGIDCWLKRVSHPIIDKWYAANAQGVSYHKDHGEGYDPYHVGSSRGCGGTALWKDGAMVTSDTFTAWRIIEQGGKRSVFELDYVYLAAEGEEPVKETKRITIEMGEPFFRADSTFTQGGKPVAALPVAVGVTTHDGKAAVTLDPAQRWVACWETIDGAALGTGAVLAKGFEGEAKEIKATGPDTGHAVLLTKTNADGVLSYFAGFGWEKAGRITTVDQWTEALAARAAK